MPCDFVISCQIISPTFTSLVPPVKQTRNIFVYTSCECNETTYTTNMTEARRSVCIFRGIYCIFSLTLIKFENKCFSLTCCDLSRYQILHFAIYQTGLPCNTRIGNIDSIITCISYASKLSTNWHMNSMNKVGNHDLFGLWIKWAVYDLDVHFINWKKHLIWMKLPCCQHFVYFVSEENA